MEETLKWIGQVFDEQQERTKPLLRLLLTVKFIDWLQDKKKAERYLLSLPYLDKEIIHGYLQDGVLPTAKEIGERFGDSEANVSQKFKRFWDKVKEKLKSFQ